MKLKIIKIISIVSLTLCGFISIYSIAQAEVNINVATVKELSTIKGIGIKKAQAIVDYRKQNGKFESIKDLDKVKGFSKKTIAKLRNQITVGEKADNSKKTKSKAKGKQFDGIININTATKKELMQLPGIGEKKAEAIIKARKQAQFKDVNDLVRAKGLSKKTVDKLRENLTVK